MLHSCNHILVPIDFTEISKAAVSLALMLAESSDSCTVHLMTSDAYLEKDFKKRLESAPHGTVIEDTINSLDNGLTRLVEEVRKEREDAGHPLGDTDITTRVSGGDALENTLAMVDELEIDIIITGTHGRSKGALKALRHTISEKLVAQAPCSVFVVKPEGYPYLTD